VKRTLVVATLVALCTSISLAQLEKAHGSWIKIVGRVLDATGRPTSWGRFYVKDTRGHFLRIKPVNPDGHFNSALLEARLDYEVYAEQGDLSSEKVLISGPKKTAEVVIILRLQKKERKENKEESH
jgi:hypothetical protein